jgi:hypothetical protein
MSGGYAVAAWVALMPIHLSREAAIRGMRLFISLMTASHKLPHYKRPAPESTEIHP